MAALLVFSSLLVATLAVRNVPGPGSPSARSSPGAEFVGRPAELEALQLGIARSEYAYTLAEERTWSAPNRAQGLRSRVSAAGLEVFPRETDASGEGAPWRVRLTARALGREGSLWPLGDADVSVEGSRAQLVRDGLVEWYVNDQRGIEQGWTITSRPDGPRETSLRLVLAVGSPLTLRLAEDGLGGRFVDAHGATLVRYEGLRVWDVRGLELEARLASGPDGPEVRVDDSTASYPITIDPVLSGPYWTVESHDPGAAMGISVQTAGDVNGDGYSDIVIGAHLYDGGYLDEGAAFAYLGSSSGFTAMVGWPVLGGQQGAQFGTSVATAGDTNADGLADVIVGAPRYNGGSPAEGRAYVYFGDRYYGGSGGLLPTPAWSWEPNSDTAEFGGCVAAAGDVNGDGYDDILVGAKLYDGGPSYIDRGRVYLFRGGVHGPEMTWAWNAGADQNYAWFGHSVASAGDINGDGYADVIVGAPWYDTTAGSNDGRVFVYLGSPTYPYLPSAPSQTWTWGTAGLRLGWSVSTAGDFDGDGYSDILVGTPYHGQTGFPEMGIVFLRRGSPTGLVAEAPQQFTGTTSYAHAGLSVGPAGDVNGDGYADFVYGAPDTVPSGGFTLVLGQPDFDITPSRTFFTTGQASDGMGTSVSAAGDVNGDGFGDVVVGAPKYDGGQTDEGRALVYLGGGVDVPSDDPSSWDVGVYDHNEYGTSVASAGDINGDGISDVVIGGPGNGPLGTKAVVVLFGGGALPPWIRNGAGTTRLGESVAGAGDVNGDGYADVLVGTPRASNGQSYEGRATLYYGGPSGLSGSISWTFESDLAGALLGTSVASAGDVNRDGFADVVLGAPGDPAYPQGGSAWLFLGSAGGPILAPGWPAVGSHPGAQFGFSVASAGDVDRDGFSDVLVGSPGYNASDGLVSLYRGRPAAPSATAPDWTWTSSPGGRIGWSVASAGDVNGDDHSDFLVGSPDFVSTSTTGRAMVFHGRATLLSTPDWTNKSIHGIGRVLASAGDLNADGYSDVAFGWPWSGSGVVGVYLGSPGGLASAGALGLAGPSSGSGFGFSVACAGDFNGDGVSDLVVGAPFWDGGWTDNGRVEFFQGNGRFHYNDTEWPLRPRQRRVDDTAPIALLGRSDAKDGFRLRLAAATTSGGSGTPMGRSRVRIERQALPLGWPLASWASVLGPSWIDTGSPSSTPLELDHLVSGVQPDTSWHWRVRIVTDDPFYPHGRWVTLAANSMTETKLATAPDCTPPTASNPASQTVCPGAQVSFATTAGGTGPFLYQWRKDGAPIAGATTATYVIASVSSSHAGAYSVEVRGACGQVVTPAATLTVSGVLGTYCTAKVNSLGCTPAISWSGNPSASHTGAFRIWGTNVISKTLGLLIYSKVGADAKPFQGGLLCLKAPVLRTALQNSGGNPPPVDCSGVFGLEFNDFIASGADPGLTIGKDAWTQYWYRDAGSPSGSGLTDALHFVICP